MPIHTCLPQDRLRALVPGETLPGRTSGSALFADISGVTALTEALRESLGARQGAVRRARTPSRWKTGLVCILLETNHGLALLARMRLLIP